MNQSEKNFIELQRVIKKLRAPDGCPWDQQQTPQSFKPYIIEEAHELAEAIDHDDSEHIKEELGDLLFQVVFLSRLYEEKKQFFLADVIDAITTKMIRRHPHVFEDKKVNSLEEQRRSWLKIKAKEKGRKEQNKGDLDFPSSLPALTKALRVSERAAKNDFQWPDQAEFLASLDEKKEELSRAVNAETSQDIFNKIGDLLFLIVHIGRINKINCEDALNSATDKFISDYNRRSKKEESDRETSSISKKLNR
ncbi:MAG: nucleoside triphosphate pyrophosphohydrolase [Desulfobulbaceae bacterium]|nr:nucleoside triphosphate pyrophosphohydrolase [Desulfobulbaceae bacterium]